MYTWVQMNLPQGFLGTRADVLIDAVIVVVALMLPVLGYSWWLVRRGRYATHRRIQVVLAAALAVGVLALEVDVRASGGVEGLTQGSALTGTPLLRGLFAVHLAIAMAATVIWGGLVAYSVRRFDSPPRPNTFSRTHVRWGRRGMVAMLLTSVTGIAFYVLGFVL